MTEQTATDSRPADQKKFALYIFLAALLGALLSLYQWWEIYDTRTSGHLPLCEVNEAISCATVWNSPLSTAVHTYTGLPIAAWGLIWSLIVIALSIQIRRAGDPRATANLLFGLRLAGVIGSLVVVALLFYSFAIKVFCPTCLAFYLLVGAITFLAFRKLSAPGGDWLIGSLHSGGWTAIAILLLIYPGLKTPLQSPQESSITTANKAPAAQNNTASTANEPPVAQFIASLRPELRQALADTLDMYRKAKVVPQPPDPARRTSGTPDAAVKLVEWIDIRCPHCRALHEALTEITSIVPPNSLSVETRHYPLDSACNPHVQRSDGKGINCTAAKALICLAGTPLEQQLRSTLFENQDRLTQDMIWTLAGQAGAQVDELQACTASPATQQALEQDIALAQAHQIEGTPLVVINGRKAPALPALIYALILVSGLDNDPAFDRLPPPRPGAG